MIEQEIDDNKFRGARLPTNIVPNHYDLTLEPDFTNFTFEGSVKINYTKNGNIPLEEILIHATDLRITEGYITVSDGRKCILTKVTICGETETASLKFNCTIPSEGVIYLKFSGILNDKMKGFYRTSYKINGQLVYAAVTQFAATDARRCFPCWDEPAIKATFTVTIIIEEKLVAGGLECQRTALSNMSTASITRLPTDGKIEIRFNRTPKMSTYLLAVVVGPLDKIELSGGKSELRLYTTPGKAEQGRFALEVADKCLKFYESYFGIDYPLDKMDLVAIPDFAFSAMENWGLITYREDALLVELANTSTSRKQYVAMVVAHELAHQWFGNLVTMEWWTHLWLNEGFASFMQYLSVNHVFPEYDVWSRFVTDMYSTGLELDELHSSHPIEVPVNHASETKEIFDVIAYNKGASIIRMIYHHIGDECFRKGMNSYLNKFAYKNAVTEDLWASLGEASNKPVAEIMSDWTSKKGFPWLSVKYLKDGNRTKLVVSQSKFTSDGKMPAEEVDNRWSIPIAAVCGSNPDKVINLGLLDKKTGEFMIENPNDDWVKLNPGSVGFYRVAYPEEVMSKLIPAIKSQTLPALDRLGLQNDLFALSKAGQVSSVQLLKLLSAYKDESDNTVWKSIDSCIGSLNSLLSNTQYQDKLHKFGKNLYSRIFEKLTWSPTEGEKEDYAMLRSTIINRLVRLNCEGVIGEAKTRFKAHLDETMFIPADLRAAVYQVVSVYCEDITFEALFDMYIKAESPEEKNRIAQALGCTRAKDRQRRVIELAFSDKVRNQERVHFISSLGATDPTTTWRLLQDKKDFLRDRFGEGHLIGTIIKCATKYFVTEERAKEVEQFFQDHKFPGTERSVQQSIETIKINCEWLNRDKESIGAYLSNL